MGDDFRKTCTDPQYLSGLLFTLVQKQPPSKGLAHLFNLKEEALLSCFTDLSTIQDSFRFRGLRRAQIIASLLIDEKGEFNPSALAQLIDLFESEGYLIYADGLNDSLLTEHMLQTLKKLQGDEALVKKLRRFQRPLCNGWAEELVRQSLGVYQPNGMTDAHVRIAVLSALLTPLRQNVGSCFATAPAILIQREQTGNLIDDLYQLLSIGKLKRVFGGIEYAVPLSPSTGIGDLRKSLAVQDDKARVSLSPGLMAACEVAGLIPHELPWEQKAEKLKALLDMQMRGGKTITVEQFIHNSLLDAYDLNDEDLKIAERLELAQAKSSRLSYYQPPKASSQKIEICQKLVRVEKMARAAFKGFCDHALLKAWEFTLASFSEVKMEFSRWNLYSSLGLHHEEAGGIGEIIYQRLGEKIEEANKTIEKFQLEYEISFDQVRGTEALLKKASTESEIRRLQAEYQSRAYHCQACLEMRDRSYSIGSNYSNLFSFLVKQYDIKFPEYFQEIYDAEMQDIQGDQYDDSPAGFRLVYKHGRSDPSMWTLIYREDQYIDALADFFNATESEIAASCDWDGGDKEILAITSAIVSHIRTPHFLETALQRMAKAHSATGSEEKKPWVYTSGGTMTTLLKTYYCRQGEFAEESRWVESESELLIFLIDSLKNQPMMVTDLYQKDPYRGMLAASPSHAFILYPSIRFFKEGWQEEGFTYTWVRDQVFSPSHQFYAAIRFDAEEQQFLVDEFSRQLPPLLSHQLHKRYSPTEGLVTVVKWRQTVLDQLTSQVSGYKRLLADGLDAFLYQTLPLVQGSEFKVIIRRLFADRFDQKIEAALNALPDAPSSLMTAKMVKDAAKGCMISAYQKVGLPFDIHQYIADHARFINLSAPTPFLFADTNWTNFFFGFVINPGTGRLELWRLDRTGSEGMPMSSWHHWINGQDRKLWSIYVRPFEYS